MHTGGPRKTSKCQEENLKQNVLKTENEQQNK